MRALLLSILLVLFAGHAMADAWSPKIPTMTREYMITVEGFAATGSTFTSTASCMEIANYERFDSDSLVWCNAVGTAHKYEVSWPYDVTITKLSWVNKEAWTGDATCKFRFTKNGDQANGFGEILHIIKDGTSLTSHPIGTVRSVDISGPDALLPAGEKLMLMQAIGDYQLNGAVGAPTCTGGTISGILTIEYIRHPTESNAE